MSSARTRLFGVAALVSAALLLAACSSDDEPAAPPITSLPIEATPDQIGPEGTSDEQPVPVDGSLSAIAEACTDGGVAMVNGSVDASSTAVDFPDCEIRLAAGVDMDLASLSVTGGNVAITKAEDGTGPHLLNFQDLSIDVESLVIVLDGPDDAFRTQRISITTSGGVDIRVGDFDGNDEGGTIHLIETSLTATAPDSGIQLLTSLGSGTLRLERTSIDAPEAPRLAGAECVAEVNDEPFECTAE